MRCRSPRVGSFRLVTWLGFLATLGISACLVDPDAPCGEGFVERADGSCVCADEKIAQGGKCVACGKDERAESGACVCKLGFERSSSGVCRESMPDAGTSGGADAGVRCDAATCASSPAAVANCESSAECADDELCDVHETAQCVSKPDGLGQSCSSDEDCADTEATYCEIFSSSTCQIEGCSERGGVCPGDMACCDFAVLARSLCIPASRLESGSCPAPGELVERQGR